MTETPKTSSRTVVIAVTALALVAALLLLVWSGPEPDEAEPTVPTAQPQPTPTTGEPEAAPPPAPPRAAAPAVPEAEPEASEPDPRPIVEGSGAGPHALPPGGTLILDARSLPQDRPVVLALSLPEEAKLQHAAHAIRVVAPDGRLLHASAAADAYGVTLEIGAEWLFPGRYLVEVKTAERTHFPLRRFAIEVR